MADSRVNSGTAVSANSQSRGLLDLMILHIPGLKTVDRNVLCNKFKNENDLVHSKNDIEAILGHPLPRKSWSMDKVRKQAEKDQKAAELRGIKTVSLAEEKYPPLLREIYDPPHLLFYLGILPNPEKCLAAIVGTRKPSSAAAAMAYNLGRDLGKAGIPVVSGLALGIDAFAHRGNLDAGASAVAVLGSGLDQIYPASNRGLARQILEKGGALFSEYAPGTGPMKWHFPARNRIISALSRGTIIVEAPEKSGALITASFVLEQDRDLWVSSVGVQSSQGKGSAKLAADGAKVINSARDILIEWGLEKHSTEGTELESQQSPDDLGTGAVLASSLAKSLNIDLRGN
ncbi:MAG: DNA-processing protein DprA [Treponema sp.]|jgi:DNA processing protein|nr:DNA-processing protein DprA [Treponema sp.]